MRRAAAALALVFALGAAQTREERAVTVGGVAETWRLEWLAVPAPICQPLDERSYTCPCAGFAYGEAGELDLVRLRDGREIDRLHLTPLFSGERTEAGDPPAEGLAALRRWPVREIDPEAFERASPTGKREFQKRVLKRKPVRILALADFNHDGWATEFVLPLGTLPCRKRQSVLVGLSPGRPKLHAFASADSPNRPLILEAEAWKDLRDAKGPIRVLESPCGDQGSEEHRDLVLQIDARGIHAARETFGCSPAGGKHGALVSRELL